MTPAFKSARLVIALVILSLALPSAAWAKGRTTRLVFTCTGFARPVVVDTGLAVDMQEGPWGGGFFDATNKTRVAPDAARRLCEVDFYVMFGPREERLAYVAYYAPAADAGAGYIYLPGRGQPWYDLNVSSMLRPGFDGVWHVASRRWEQMVARPALAAAG